MIYFATLRYTRGLGNAAVYLRFRDVAGQYLIVGTGAWQVTEDATCQAFLPEVTDSTTESRYQAEVTLPLITVDSVAEYVLAATGAVLAEATRSPDSVTPTPSGSTTLATLTDLRVFLDEWNDDQARPLQALLDAAGAEIERSCGRTFASTEFTETYDYDSRRYVVLRNIPVIAVNSVTRQSVDSDGTVTTTPVTAYLLNSQGWINIYDLTFQQGDQVIVDYNAGYSTIPADVTSAVAELASVRYKSRDRIGVMSRTDSATGQTSSYQVLSLPMSAKAVIDRYRRWVA